MADALCGPSNPLQSIQKHSQVDRTLQQDRLRFHQSSSQGFRSGHGANQGLLDPEFEAFQAGHPSSTQFAPHPLQTHFYPQAQQSHFQAPSALPDWASDFQRLHIAPTRSGSSHHIQPIARHQPMTAWQQDFFQSQQATSVQHQPSFQSHVNQPWQNTFHLSQTTQPYSSVAQGKQAEGHVQFDAAAFEAAFDAAQSEAMASENAMAAEMEAERVEIDRLVATKAAKETANRHARQETNHLSAMDLSESLNAEEQAVLGSGRNIWPDSTAPGYPGTDYLATRPALASERARHESPQERPQHSGLDDEELSRTAGQLLDSVSQDTSQKFQDSVFLQLMRRIRDREVRVEGENFVEADGAPSLSTTLPVISGHENENEMDLEWLDRQNAEQTTSPISMPSRPLTPEIDPPGPTLATWRERLFLPAWG